MNDDISPTSFQKSYLLNQQLFIANHLSSFTSGDMEFCTQHVSSGSSLNVSPAGLGSMLGTRKCQRKTFWKNKFGTLNLHTLPALGTHRWLCPRFLLFLLDALKHRQNKGSKKRGLRGSCRSPIENSFKQKGHGSLSFIRFIRMKSGAGTISPI